MNGLLVRALSLVLQAPETGVFARNVMPSQDGGSSRTTVTAGKRQMSCQQAERAGHGGDWGLTT
jgi:hypothetical protein